MAERKRRDDGDVALDIKKKTKLKKPRRYNVILHLDESGLDGGKASTRLRMMQPHAGAPEVMHFPLRILHPLHHTTAGLRTGCHGVLIRGV